ncbi:MAG TPA: hypothetical protein VJ835_03930 [Fimbriimonadaceae bacterium]|nr:hypothetical protein [Fimbriimonadaceae bacterium]
MRYFVIGANGELFGPADIPTLNQWIAEGRVLPTTMVQEELGGARFAASMLTGLAFSAQYPRAQSFGNQYVQDGATEMKNAWTYGIIGLFCFGIILGPVGLFYAIKAKQLGHPQAIGGIILCGIVTALSVLGMFLILSGNSIFGRL